MLFNEWCKEQLKKLYENVDQHILYIVQRLCPQRACILLLNEEAKGKHLLKHTKQCLLHYTFRNSS